MVVIGVTGGVGTGKSTVSSMFKQLGARILDADALAHEAMEPGRLAWRQIVKTFGDDILNEDRTINRRLLAQQVFSDETARKRLEAIVHPQVLRRIKQELHRVRRRRAVRAVVLDVPLLAEAGAQELVDALVVVTAEPSQQRQRLARRRGWTEEDVARRAQAQWDLSTKVALADYVVDNRDGLERTRRQVRQIWHQVMSNDR